MTVEDFKQQVRECRTELEVRRLALFEWDRLRGTPQELWDALEFADNHALTLADVPPVERVLADCHNMADCQ